MIVRTTESFVLILALFTMSNAVHAEQSQPARLTELKMSSTLNVIVELPPLLENQGSLGVRLIRCVSG